MTKNTLKLFPVIIALLFVIPSVSLADPVVEDHSNASVTQESSVSEVVTTNQGNAGVTETVGSGPTTIDQGNAGVINTQSTGPTVEDQGNAGVINTQSTGPTVEDQGNAGVTDNVGSAPEIIDQGNASVTDSTPTPPANTGGGSSSGSSGFSGSFGGSSSSSGGTFVFPTNLPVLTDINQCKYLSDYMKFGDNNPTSEVTKLQTFLKNTEKIDVDITGIFDQKTLDAVKAFQQKYLAEIMLPWGSTNPTGQVYFTTRKKINEIFCKTNFTLTVAQKAEIESYKNAVEAGENPLTGTNSQIGSENSTTTATSTSIGGKDPKNPSQTAAVGDTSFFTKLWNFIKRIFGR